MTLDNQPYSYRRVATQGCELVGPEGIFGWTVDDVIAARIVALLNRDAGADNSGETQENHPDDETTARRAIEYLADHDPVVLCTFPPGALPSPEVRRLVEPYLRDAVVEIRNLLSRYAQQQLAKDFLGLSGPVEIVDADTAMLERYVAARRAQDGTSESGSG